MLYQKLTTEYLEQMIEEKRNDIEQLENEIKDIEFEINTRRC